MTLDLDKYAFTDGATSLSAAELNTRFYGIIRRLHALELLSIDWAAAVTQVQNYGLARINDAVQPLIDSLKTDLTAVVAQGEAALASQSMAVDAKLAEVDARMAEIELIVAAAANHAARTDNPHGVTAEQTEAVPLAVVGHPSGVATLDDAGRHPITQIGPHAAIHAAGGRDALTPAAVGALGLDMSSEVSITVTTTLTAAAFGKMHVVNNLAADGTIGLPAATGNAGKLLGIRIAQACTKLVTLDANAAELIDGATTRVMWAGESAILLCDGSGWTKIAGKSIPMQCQLSATSSQIVASGAFATLKMDQAVIDTGGMSLLTSNKIVIKRNNVYNLHALIELSAYINYSIIFAINPWRYASSSGLSYASISITTKLTKGQDVCIMMSQTSGINATTTGQYASVLASEIITW